MSIEPQVSVLSRYCGWLATFVVIAADCNAQIAIDAQRTYVQSSRLILPASAFPIEDRLQPTELLFSKNGAPWQFAGWISPVQSSYVFDAGSDGEYRFATNTVAKDPAGFPIQQPLQPHLTVVVDSIQPEVRADVQISPEGRIVVEYEIHDDLPAKYQMNLKYKLAATAPWQWVKDYQHVTQVNSTTFQAGVITWAIDANSEALVMVAFSVSDLAGNVTTVMGCVEKPAGPMPTSQTLPTPQETMSANLGDRQLEWTPRFKPRVVYVASSQASSTTGRVTLGRPQPVEEAQH